MGSITRYLNKHLVLYLGEEHQLNDRGHSLGARYLSIMLISPQTPYLFVETE